MFSRADELESVGLDIPQITRLMLELKSRGVDVEDGIYTIKDAASSLSRIL